MGTHIINNAPEDTICVLQEDQGLFPMVSAETWSSPTPGLLDIRPETGAVYVDTTTATGLVEVVMDFGDFGGETLVTSGYLDVHFTAAKRSGTLATGLFPFIADGVVKVTLYALDASDNVIRCYNLFEETLNNSLTWDANLDSFLTATNLAVDQVAYECRYLTLVIAPTQCPGDQPIKWRFKFEVAPGAVVSFCNFFATYVDPPDCQDIWHTMEENNQAGDFSDAWSFTEATPGSYTFSYTPTSVTIATVSGYGDFCFSPGMGGGYVIAPGCTNYDFSIGFSMSGDIGIDPFARVTIDTGDGSPYVETQHASSGSFHINRAYNCDDGVIGITLQAGTGSHAEAPGPSTVAWSGGSLIGKPDINKLPIPY